MPHSKPLLTRDDLPLAAIAGICRRWGVQEMAVNTEETRPPLAPVRYVGDANPFTEVDLYLIVDFGPGQYSWYFKEHYFHVLDDLQELLGCYVWIEDKGHLNKHVEDGVAWAHKTMERRDVIYATE